jgi:uncharacterized protein
LESPLIIGDQAFKNGAKAPLRVVLPSIRQLKQTAIDTTKNSYLYEKVLDGVIWYKMSFTDIKQIRETLQKRELKRREHNETLRRDTLEKAKTAIRNYFAAYPGTTVYLTGSIVKPGAFFTGSDIDIAVENFPGSRLDLYTDLSYLIEWPIDVIIMEKCHFADSIRRNGILISKTLDQ